MSKQTIMSVNASRRRLFILSFVFPHVGVHVLFFQKSLTETSLNSEGNNSILVLYFNVYDIHVNTLFKAVKNGLTVKVKKYLYSSAERS